MSFTDHSAVTPRWRALSRCTGSSRWIALVTSVRIAASVSGLGLSLFGTAPAKRRPGYANFAVVEPPLKLVLLEGAGPSFSAGADLEWMRRMAGFSHQENLDDASRHWGGLELEFEAPHRVERPIVMDSTVDQIDGYRFVYSLPFEHALSIIPATAAPGAD